MDKMTIADRLKEVIDMIKAELIILTKTGMINDAKLIRFISEMKNLTWYMQTIANIDEKDTLEYQMENIKKLIVDLNDENNAQD